MNDRIKYIRTERGMTQTEIAEKLGLSQNYIWMIEKGERSPSDRTINDICREFGVNETWLRTGEGEPFKEPPREEEISAFIGRALADEAPQFQKQLLHVLSRLSGEQWELLADIAEKLYEEQKKG